IFFRPVGEYEPVIADFTFGFQETNNGNEWGYACTARDKYALTTVFDSTEDIIQDERIARRKCPQFVSHALPWRVRLDGEFKVIVCRKTGKGKRSPLLLPSGLVKKDFRGLTGRK